MKKIEKDSDNFLHRKLMLKSEFCNFDNSEEVQSN